MTLEDCYQILGGNYEDVCKRMRKSALVEKFVLRFLSDPTFQSLTQALQQEEYEEAFRFAHTLKGMCQNLSFDQLYNSSSALNEALRHQEKEKYEILFEQVQFDYKQTIEAIKAYQETKE